MVEIFEKYRFWSKFSIDRHLGREFKKNLDFDAHFGKISILVEIIEKNLDFGRNSEKHRLWKKFWKNLDYNRNFRKILILVAISKDLDFGRNIRQILILVEILEKSRILWKFLKKFRFGSKFSIILDFVGKFRKILI